MDYTVHDTPWPHGHSESFVDNDMALQMYQMFPEWTDAWPTEFKTEHGYKKEWSEISNLPDVMQKFMHKVYADDFVAQLSDTFNISLTVDWNLYGAGLNIFPPGSYLQKHIDFNYNNDLKKYRAVNLLYFLNDDWMEGDGGCFELYDKDRKLIKSIEPKLNHCVIFATNNDTTHGVSVTQNAFYRKSINLWYYTDNPTALLDSKPHRTLWQD